MNDGNSQKTPISQSLNRLASARANNVQWLQGKSFPASVTAVVSSGIVTAKFEVNAAPFTLPEVTVPILGSQYVQLPIQVGDKGFLIAADVQLAVISGLGGGGSAPALTQPANLEALAFAWLGAADWPEPNEADALTLYQNIAVKPDALAFFGASTVAQQSITGALSAVTDPAAQAVLTSIIAALAEDGYGLVTDDTT